MSQRNILNNNELKYFYDSRKKFDKVISEIMGQDVHLHDLSENSEEQDSNPILNMPPVEEQRIKKRFSYEPHQKFEEIYSTIDNASKKEKLYKDYISLQQKLRKVENDNKKYKHNSQLWEKVKEFIEGKVGKDWNLKSISYGSSDAVKLEEFLMKINELREQRKLKRTSSQLKEEEYLTQMLNEAKNKISQNTEVIYKLEFNNERLERENELLNQKMNILLEGRKQRFDEIKSDIGEKFEAIETELLEKKKQNDELREKINKIERQSFLSNSILSNKKKDISFGEQEQLETSLLNEKEGMKKLKAENEQLSQKIIKLKKANEKYKKIIGFAKNLNDEFLLRIESSINTENKDIFQRSPAKQYFEMTPNKSKGSFHLKNSQFKFIQDKGRVSQSCKKDILKSHDSNL